MTEEKKICWFCGLDPEGNKTEEKRICPLVMITAVLTSFKGVPDAGENIFCVKEQCQWWMYAKNSKGNVLADCAIVILAMKNK